VRSQTEFGNEGKAELILRQAQEDGGKGGGLFERSFGSGFAFAQERGFGKAADAAFRSLRSLRRPAVGGYRLREGALVDLSCSSTHESDIGGLCAGVRRPEVDGYRG
jgi:hypothetical protein